MARRRVVAQCKKGRAAHECSLRAARRTGGFLRGDSVCDVHVAELKQVYMLTAHALMARAKASTEAAAKPASARAQLAAVAEGAAAGASAGAAPSTRYCIGHAASSRSKCSDGCGKLIAEGELRLGVERRFGAPPAHHYEAKWRHVECATAKVLANALAAAGGAWSGLRGWEQLAPGEQVAAEAVFAAAVAASPASTTAARKRPRGA